MVGPTRHSGRTRKACALHGLLEKLSREEVYGYKSPEGMDKAAVSADIPNRKQVRNPE